MGNPGRRQGQIAMPAPLGEDAPQFLGEGQAPVGRQKAGGQQQPIFQGGERRGADEGG